MVPLKLVFHRILAKCRSIAFDAATTDPSHLFIDDRARQALSPRICDRFVPCEKWVTFD